MSASLAGVGFLVFAAAQAAPATLTSDAVQVDELLCVATYVGNAALKAGNAAFRGDAIKVFMTMDTPAPKAKPACGAPLRAEARGAVAVEAGGFRSSGQELAVYDFRTGAVRARGPDGGAVTLAPLQPRD